MAANWKLRSALCLSFLAIVAAIAFIADAAAQDAGKTPWIAAGFVRPGTPEGGKVGDGIEGTLGGTIYYAVYQLPTTITNPADPYNTGLADFTKDFVAGSGSNGAKSPASLVPTNNLPKYLYLYQIVNDRGLEQSSKGGITFAGLNTEVKTRDIGSMVLKLAIEPSMVHSWGYFKNAGFAIDAIDRDASGTERPASLPAKTRLGVSANPSVLVKLHNMDVKGYNRMAKPVEFKANSGFGVDRAGKNLMSSLFYQELSKPGIKTVAWQQDALTAAKTGGDAPESVDLMKFTDGDKAKAPAVIRASFAANPLKVGKNSVLIGFTTNAAPGQDLVRIQDAEAIKKAPAIRTVSTDDVDFGAGGIIAMPKIEAKDANIALGAGKPTNLMVQGLVTPGDGSRLVDKGAYKTFGGTVYFAVYRKVSAAGGDTWGVGRSDFDSLFNAGESYRGTFSPRLDTDAEYLYLYEVVNDRGFHDLKLPQNRDAKNIPVAGELPEERPAITREVASFSLFLRTDPRLITSWGFFDDAGFNVKVPDEVEIKQAANDPNAKPAGMQMAVSSNLSILDTLYPNKDKVYRPWAPPVAIDFSRTNLGVGKDTLNIEKNRTKLVGNDRAGSYIRLAAAKTLDTVKENGAVRPDYAQIIYFDGANPIHGATIDGITLGPAEVARAIFKVEWLTKNITEGQQSVVFGFTSNVEPVRAPVRIKDLNTTINDSNEAQERTFLSPDQIKTLAMNAVRANAPGVTAAPAIGAAPGIGQAPAVGIGQAPAVGIGQAPGIGIGQAPGIGIGQAPGVGVGPAAAVALAGLNTDAPDAAFAVANGLGQGIIPAGLGILARGSIGTGIAISPSVATPNVGTAGEGGGGGGAGVVGMPQVSGSTGTTATGGGGIGGLGGSVGALGTARMPFVGGGGGIGGGGGGTGSNQGSAGTSSDTSGTSNGQGQGTGTSNGTITNNINFTISQNQQQNQNQFQIQKQGQNQSGHGHHGGHHGSVVPAPASLLLGLLGVPGLYFAYRRRRQTPTETSDAETPIETPTEA